MQAKLDVLAEVTERREPAETDPYVVLMVGDSTMSHQYGALCGFVGQREGRHFDPNVNTPVRPFPAVLSRAGCGCRCRGEANI